MSSTSPPAAAATTHPNAPASASNTASVNTASAALHITGTSRHASTSARATINRRGGAKVRASLPACAARGRRIGGMPSQEVPALARFGVADSTPTRPRLGTLRPGAVIPELPRNAPLPTRAVSTRSHPPPSS